MRSYVLIQDYPNSPALGTRVDVTSQGEFICQATDDSYTAKEIENFPNFWKRTNFTVSLYKGKTLLKSLDYWEDMSGEKIQDMEEVDRVVIAIEKVSKEFVLGTNITFDEQVGDIYEFEDDNNVLKVKFGVEGEQDGDFSEPIMDLFNGSVEFGFFLLTEDKVKITDRTQMVNAISTNGDWNKKIGIQAQYVKTLGNAYVVFVDIDNMYNYEKRNRPTRSIEDFLTLYEGYDPDGLEDLRTYLYENI